MADEIAQLRIVAYRATTACTELLNQVGVHLGEVGHHLWACLPHAFAHRLEHSTRHILKGGRILPFEEFYGTKVLGICNVHVIDSLPEFTVYHALLHHIPAVGVGYRLVNSRCSTCPFCQHLLHIGRIQDGSSSLHPYSLLNLLGTHPIPIAQVREIPFRILARNLMHRERKAAHEFIHMV